MALIGVLFRGVILAFSMGVKATRLIDKEKNISCHLFE